MSAPLPAIRRALAPAVLALAAASGAWTAAEEAAPQAAAAGPAPAEEPPSGKAWSFSLMANTYIVPDKVYEQPTATADRGWLHLEARYNYEALETGSAWIGYNFGVGEKLTLEFTPMVGGVFGDTNGVAPGYRLTLGFWKLELYSEGEYVIDAGDSADNFFYTWSELTISPLEWFRAGLVTQRTRAYQTDLDIQRGLLAGFSYKWFDFLACVFNLDESKPTVVLGVGANF